MTTMVWDMARFNADIQRIMEALHRNAGSYVRTMARRVVKRLAWNCPRAPNKWFNRGRARAGFWPAATVLNITSIYTPFPNKGEGQGIDQTNDATNPQFTIINTVPYILHITHAGLGWITEGIEAATDQAYADLERYMQATCDGRTHPEMLG